MRGWGCWLALLLSSGCAHRLECREHGGAEVVRVSSEHFEVVSTLPAATAQRHVARLERLWSGLDDFFGFEPPRPEGLRLVLLDEAGAREFSPSTGALLHTSIPPLVLTTMRDEQTVAAWAPDHHHFLHVLTNAWLPRQPRWLAEALAGYLATTHFLDESQLRFGGGAWPGGPVATLERLWDWDRATGTANEERHRFASAWAYLHYLADHDSQRLARLWPALRTAASAREGFESVVPVSEWPALQHAVQAFVDAGRFGHRLTPSGRPPAPGETRALETWEVHVVRGELLSALSMSRAAEQEYALAERLAPPPLPTVVALGRLVNGRPWGPRRTDALLALAKAPDAPVGVFLELATRADLGPDERLRFAEEGLARNPGSAHALSLVAEQAALVPGRLERALAASEALTQRAPWSYASWIVRAESLAAASRCREAQRALDVAESQSREKVRATSAQVLHSRHAIRDTCREAP